MSDLQDIIANTSVKAFNSGYLQGAYDERLRIIEIIKKRRDYDCRCQCDCHAEPAPCVACQADGELIDIIMGVKNDKS